MAEIHLPLSITYETEGVTPISDVIEALKATDAITRDAVSLLPSLIDGLKIEKSSLNVRSLNEGSLREVFLVALFVAYQEELETAVPTIFEDLFKVDIPQKYDTLLTVVFLIVVFYGVGFAIDALNKTVTASRSRRILDEMIGDLATVTGKTEDQIHQILEARFSKPTSARGLITSAKRFFLPSQRKRNAPVVVGPQRIDSEVVREVPFAGKDEKPTDFDRYAPHQDVTLEIHAMDRDRAATGWAAVAKGISDKRLKMKVKEPLSVEALWGKDAVVGDIVVVSKLTSDGYVPAEIHLTTIKAEGPSAQSRPDTGSETPPKNRPD